MTQFLDCKDNDFLFYYTRPHLSGTPEFEHKVRIPYSVLKHPKRMDQSDDEDGIQIECPCGCGAVATVPVLGGEECQRLHARFKAHKEAKPYIEQAIRETMDRVKSKGGEPKLDPKKG